MEYKNLRKVKPSSIDCYSLLIKTLILKLDPIEIQVEYQALKYKG